ncbi:type II toxin-antitoxin system prevent-host-death family antitoxin [Acidithiobacillus thiooxidans]
MNTQWPLQDARNHLSDVVKRARSTMVRKPHLTW